MADDVSPTGTGRSLPWRWLGWGLAGFLLVLPAIAMQFTTEVNWGLGDFLVMGFMFAILGMGLELAVRASRNNAYRTGAAMALVTGFLVTWSNLAVGIIADEDHPANGMFFGVIAAAVIGAFLSQFRARGMGWAMTFAAIGQFVVPFIAIAIWNPPFSPDLVKTIAFNSIFAAMWYFSAAMFRNAAADREADA